MDIAQHPPIELVAARIRDLRQTASVLASTPDVVDGTDAELRRVVADYDELLMIAATQVGLDLEPLNGDGTGLPDHISLLDQFAGPASTVFALAPADGGVPVPFLPGVLRRGQDSIARTAGLSSLVVQPATGSP